MKSLGTLMQYGSDLTKCGACSSMAGREMDWAFDFAIIYIYLIRAMKSFKVLGSGKIPLNVLAASNRAFSTRGSTVQFP